MFIDIYFCVHLDRSETHFIHIWWASFEATFHIWCISSIYINGISNQENELSVEFSWKNQTRTQSRMNVCMCFFILKWLRHVQCANSTGCPEISFFSRMYSFLHHHCGSINWLIVYLFYIIFVHKWNIVNSWTVHIKTTTMTTRPLSRQIFPWLISIQLMSVFDNWFCCLLLAAESINSQIEMHMEVENKKNENPRPRCI